jgi:DNA (cytosine-5)-methyltransferase 1
VGRNTFNVLSLCAGVGGLDIGLRLAEPDARVVCYVEREAYCCEVLASRMEDGSLDAAPVWSNLRTFDGRPWRGVVDCVTGGYPCQPFSVAGKRRADRDERHLWPSVRQIISEVRPGAVFLENVAGHLSLGFEAVANDLQGMGYRLAAGLFTAEEVGATHRRERLFILGHAECASRRPEHPARRHLAGHDGLQVGRDETSDRPPVASAPLVSPPGEPRERRACAGLPLHPPGPDDHARWDAVLASRPDVAPAFEPRIRGVADGLATRLDGHRRRAIGNGVCPLAAAYAWRTLQAVLRADGPNTDGRIAT